MSEIRAVWRLPLWAWRGAFLGYLAFVGFAVFAPMNEARRITGVVEVTAAHISATFHTPFPPTFNATEFAANIILFIPFGLFVLVLAPHVDAIMTIAVALATTLGIELIQQAIPGRTSSIWDVLANLLGALLGIALARVSATSAKHQTRQN